MNASDAAASGAGEKEARAWIATHYPAAVDTNGADRLVHAFAAGAAAAPKVASNAAGLREALKPFAKWADWYDGMLADDNTVAHGRGELSGKPPSYIRVGDLRRARKALATDATDGATGASEAAGLREALEEVARISGERAVINCARAALAATPIESATRADHAQGGGEPFAYFQRNEGWGIWEEVGTDHKGDDPSIVAAYRHPPTTPGADLLEQADIVDVVLPIIVRNTPSVGRSAHHVACEVADAVLRALSPARDGAGS